MANQHTEAVDRNNFLATLDNMGVIQVSGDEALSYLQGQVTVDMLQTSPEKALFGCHCDFKGKTWSIFYALRDASTVNLVTHQESLQRSLPELKKYGVFSKVDISDQSATYHVLGGTGQAVQHAIEAVFGDVPVENQQVVSKDDNWVMAITSPSLRFMMVLKEDLCETFTKQFAAPLASNQLWESLDIEAGIANIQAPTVNEFVPQMMNMQALDAIDFQKGCYMGQEVVARTKYLGKNKRAAFYLQGHCSADVHAGDILEMQAGENWRRGGVILRSARIGDQCWLLAVLPNDTESAKVFRSKTHPEAFFTVQSLPYNLE